ncbi:hypothetical protein EsDP_00007137 [Epichloe bromicola]|uniref:N-acetyltransferase domain-containing protein n=1 Tax=Epichloe bromicola TaxID=79588 RepID=A0ABQ0CZN8_9HYPO
MPTTPTLRFRTATPSDAPSIHHLVESAFRTTDPRPNWTGNTNLASSFRLDMDDVKARIANPDVATLLAFTDHDTLAASIEVSRHGNLCGRLSMIAVDDAYQRSGVGGRVLEYAEEYCRKVWAVNMFSLNALSTRKALIEWYLRRGYSRTGETSPFPRESFEGLELPPGMCFVEMEKRFDTGEGCS